MKRNTQIQDVRDQTYLLVIGVGLGICLLTCGCRSPQDRKGDGQASDFYDLVRIMSPGPRVQVFGAQKRAGFELLMGAEHSLKGEQR